MCAHINGPIDGPLQSGSAGHVIAPRPDAALAVAAHRVGAADGEGLVGRQVAQDHAAYAMYALGLRQGSTRVPVFPALATLRYVQEAVKVTCNSVVKLVHVQQQAPPLAC